MGAFVKNDYPKTFWLVPFASFATSSLCPYAAPSPRMSDPTPSTDLAYVQTGTSNVVPFTEAPIYIDPAQFSSAPRQPQTVNVDVRQLQAMIEQMQRLEARSAELEASSAAPTDARPILGTAESHFATLTGGSLASKVSNCYTYLKPLPDRSSALATKSAR